MFIDILLRIFYAHFARRFDWEEAITERNDWLELYAGRPRAISFNEYINQDWPTPGYSLCLVRAGYRRYRMLSDEDKVTVTLMGW